MNRTTSNDRKTRPVSISLEKPLLKAGKAQAKKLRRPFSSYVALLLERDMETAK